MNRIIAWTAALLMLISATGCKKEMMGYEGLEGIYFAVQFGSSALSEASWPFVSNTTVEFLKVAGDETTAYKKVMITGPVKDYDRPFRVEVNPDSTTAVLNVHYKPLATDLVIPANSTTAYVPVTFIRTPEMKNEVIRLGLRLLPNEYFQLSFPEWDAIPGRTSFNGAIEEEFDASLHTILVNDFMVKPAVWPGSITPENKESGTFGAFTEKKMNLICDVMHLTYNDFSSAEIMPLVLQLLIASEFSNYLIAQFNAGTPVLEDDGRLMWFGSVPWSSYIGVKWVP